MLYIVYYTLKLNACFLSSKGDTVVRVKVFKFDWTLAFLYIDVGNSVRLIMQYGIKFDYIVLSTPPIKINILQQQIAHYVVLY